MSSELEQLGSKATLNRVLDVDLVLMAIVVRRPDSKGHMSGKFARLIYKPMWVTHIPTVVMDFLILLKGGFYH